MNVSLFYLTALLFPITLLADVPGNWTDKPKECGVPLALSAPAGADEAAVGIWEAQVRGKSGGKNRETGLAYLVFASDQYFLLYAMTTNSFGPLTMEGSWQSGSTGQITGSYWQNNVPFGTAGGTFTGKVSAKKLVLKTSSTALELTFNAAPVGVTGATRAESAQAFVDAYLGRQTQVVPTFLLNTPQLSGSWRGAVAGRTVNFKLKQLTAATPGIFSLDVPPESEAAPDGSFAWFIVSSKGKVFGLIGQLPDFVASVGGSYNQKKTSVALKGIDWDRMKVKGTVTLQP